MTDVDAPYVLAIAEKEKKCSATKECCASFSPFVVTVDGVLGDEAGFFALFGRETTC